MLRSLFLILSIVVAGVAFAASSKTYKVTMKSISYDPKVLNIKVGESVQWENKSYTQHSATADDTSFETGLIEPNRSTKKVLFDKPGTFKYHCSMHGKTMSGTVVVAQ